MRIVVCIKAVKKETTGYAFQSDASSDYKVNRFDLYAAEAAAQLKESCKESHATVVSAGPQGIEPVIRRVMAMGLDYGIHIIMPEVEYTDPCVCARLLADVIAPENPDLVVCGAMSEDDANMQTGQMIAGFLRLRWASFVASYHIDKKHEEIELERELEGGITEKLRMSLPALITVASGINRPRYPKVTALIKAAEAEIKKIVIPDDITRQSRLHLVKLTDPPKVRKGELICGSTKQKAKRLAEILRDRGFL